MRDKVQSWIDKHLEKKNSKPRVRSGKWSPSLFGRCYRLQYLNRKDAPKSNPPDERTVRVFEAGNLFHSFVQDIVVKQSKKAEIEVKVELKDVLGYADIVTADEVIEIKSQHSMAFSYMKDNFIISYHKKGHVMQAMLYAYILKKDKARLVYVSKDDLRIAEYTLERTEKWDKEIEKELKTLRKFWYAEKIPPAIPRAFPDKNDKPTDCKICPFKTTCFETEKLSGRGKPYEEIKRR